MVVVREPLQDCRHPYGINKSAGSARWISAGYYLSKQCESVRTTIPKPAGIWPDDGTQLQSSPRCCMALTVGPFFSAKLRVTNLTPSGIVTESTRGKGLDQ